MLCPKPEAAVGPLPPSPVQLARCIYASRREREVVFGAGLFGEPAWDLLLDIYIAGAEGKALSVSSACVGAGVPESTALRRLRRLERDGLVLRRRCPVDARVVYLTLADAAREALELLLERWSARAPGGHSCRLKTPAHTGV